MTFNLAEGEGILNNVYIEKGRREKRAPGAPISSKG